MHQQTTTTTTITTEDNDDDHDDDSNDVGLLLSIVWLFVESRRVVAIVICASVSLIDCIRRPLDDAADGG